MNLRISCHSRISRKFYARTKTVIYSIYLQWSAVPLLGVTSHVSVSCVQTLPEQFLLAGLEPVLRSFMPNGLSSACISSCLVIPRQVLTRLN